MIRPQLRLRMLSMIGWVMLNMELRSTRITSFHISGVIL